MIFFFFCKGFNPSPLHRACSEVLARDFLAVDLEDFNVFFPLSLFFP